MRDLHETKEPAVTGHSAVFPLVVENNEYHWHHQYISRGELIALANLSANARLYLAVEAPWEDQLVDDKTKIDLGRSAPLHFFIKKDLKLTINKKPYTWHREYISREQLIHLGTLDAKDEIFLEVPAPDENELITDKSRINLALKGEEHFISKKVEKEVIIIVNGTPKKWDEEKISFKEVIILAYGSYIDRPTMVYTVAFEDGPKQNPEGSMVKDSIVFVKNKMIFHATATDKS